MFKNSKINIKKNVQFSFVFKQTFLHLQSPAVYRSMFLKQLLSAAVKSQESLLCLKWLSQPYPTGLQRDLYQMNVLASSHEILEHVFEILVLKDLALLSTKIKLSSVTRSS